MTVLVDEIDKKPADCSVCDLCTWDEDERKHYCAVNSDWVYPYGESINIDCPINDLIQCKDCRFFRENWKCVTWHMFVKPSGFCYRAEANTEEPEEERDEDSCCM